MPFFGYQMVFSSADYCDFHMMKTYQQALIVEIASNTESSIVSNANNCLSYIALPYLCDFKYNFPCSLN